MDENGLWGHVVSLMKILPHTDDNDAAFRLKWDSDFYHLSLCTDTMLLLGPHHHSPAHWLSPQNIFLPSLESKHLDLWIVVLGGKRIYSMFVVPPFPTNIFLGEEEMCLSSPVLSILIVIVSLLLQIHFLCHDLCYGFLGEHDDWSHERNTVGTIEMNSGQTF